MRKLRATLALLACVAGLAPASSAHAQAVPGKEYAKKLFDEGNELEKKADYAGALAKFKEAEQITATPGLRFHEGYCLEMTGKLAAALEQYELADKMARDQGKQDVRAAVTVRIEPLRARVPQIAIRLATAAKDAEVQLDGVTVAAPLLDGKAFRLDPGEHTVTARAGGYKAFSRKVLVPESATTTVDVSLDRVAGAPVVVVEPVPVGPAGPVPPATNAPPVTEPPTEPSPGRSYVAPIVTTAGAVVLAGFGLTMFFVAGGKQSSAQTDCLAKTSCDDEQSSVRTFDALALGGFIGAVGLGVVSLVLWTSNGPQRSAGRIVPVPATGARLVATPRLVGLEGAF